MKVYYYFKHILNVTYERIKINRMICNFKIDNNEKIWFLFCTSIRTETRQKSAFYAEKLCTNIYECPNIDIQVHFLKK